MSMNENRTLAILCLTLVATLAMLGVCWAAPPPPPSTPLTPPGSIGGAIYAAVIVGVAVVGFWKMRK
jgi:hypothetical protein